MFPKSAQVLLVGCTLLLGLTGCPGDASKKMADKQKALDDKKANDKAKADEKQKAAEAPKDVVRLDPPWEDSAYVLLRSDGACPENFWALFGGDPPGATKEEKKANAARRPELAKALREKTYLVKLRAPDDVKLHPFDATKNEFPVDVLGTIDCTDSIGRIAIAWTAAKAGDPGASAAKEGAEVTQNIWMAPPMKFNLPMKGMADAKEFDQKNKLGLSARLFFKLGKGETDKKLKKMAKVVEKAAGETLTIGGGTEDWGAGRMIRAEGVGVRIASEKEKTSLIERKP
ncbi:MAG: hypothetical protein H6Q89_3395 [Myxococcaceae bacterium]|nr:hypothetical protein [Myxococcaceae bacterium]